ncbi:hypothetical protein TRICI_004367 [Trichomonascus ciferrii]|uniref:Xylanolytic transcriptional activator regulatory domain-containing protein n=1 Tax=Trichomonascus ciferrii TaxID=44093 RepID=A0A642V0R5_9ASCO|nr:hypothetical protein TRICI_004367 [Trichomonascus ciferrii]
MVMRECSNKDNAVGREISRSYLLALEERVREYEQGNGDTNADQQRQSKQPRLSAPEGYRAQDDHLIASPSAFQQRLSLEGINGGSHNHHQNIPQSVSSGAYQNDNEQINRTQQPSQDGQDKTVCDPFADRNGRSILAQTTQQHEASNPQVQDNRQQQQPQQAENRESSRIDDSPESLSSPPSLSGDGESTAPSTMDTVLASTLSGGAGIHLSEDITSQLGQYSNGSVHQESKELFIQREKAALRKLTRDFLKQARYNTTKDRTTEISAYKASLLHRLTKRYFTWMNSAYPVLHECVFHLQLEKCRSDPASASAFDLYQVNMVMAIALASISRPHLSTSEIGRVAHDFWKSATKNLNNVLNGRGIHRLQNILLLLQYTLLVPKAGNLWQLSGTAMRFATEMGLYTEPNPTQDFDPLKLDVRRRVFWTCYCIDRTLATVMGRPTSIPEVWITAKIPALVEDSLITVNNVEPGPTCQLKVAQLLNIRILYLQSEIHGRLYAPGAFEMSPQEDLTTWSWHMYDQLRLWRASLSNPTPLITKEWAELQFHIAVVLLFRPSPKRPNPSEEASHVAFHSAGEAVKLVKLMHRDSSAVFAWLTVQNLFMCGLTFINSLKEISERRNSRGLCVSLVDVFLQIQACSSMLETLSALESGSNERLRNVFEMASSQVLHNLTNSSSTLQHNSEPCIWSQLARSDSTSVQRPIYVSGKSVEIQTTTNWNFYIPPDSEPNNQHFYHHDVDAVATTEQGILQTHAIAPSLYSTNPPSTNHNQNARNGGASRLASATPNGPQPVQNIDVPQMDGLATISAVASQAEPIRNFGDVPDDGNLGAELERWFFYPFPELSPSISDLTPWVGFAEVWVKPVLFQSEDTFTVRAGKVLISQFVTWVLKGLRLAWLRYVDLTQGSTIGH